MLKFEVGKVVEDTEKMLVMAFFTECTDEKKK